ncbi:MAG: hypothetical protein ACTSUE_24280 [Promethearchaeota archaeon]
MGSGTVRFGFFTEDFEIIFYGLEHALAPLDVFYFAGLPFIIIGLVILVHTIVNTKIVAVNVFDDRYEFVVHLFMTNYDSIRKTQIISTEVGTTTPRYKWIAFLLVVLLSLNVQIGWGISNAVILPVLSRQLLTSGAITIACMIIFIVNPKKHVKIDLIDSVGKRDVAEFKMNPVMSPRAWRDLARHLDAARVAGPTNDENDGDTVIEPARERKVGNFIDLIVGSTFLLIGMLSFKNKLLIVGVGVPSIMIIFGIRMIARWFVDVPLSEKITRTKRGDVYLNQKNFLGFRARRWNMVKEFRVIKDFKLDNFFDTFLIMALLANATWYITRTWFPTFNYLGTSLQFWITSLAVIVTIAWRHFHLKPFMLVGQEVFNGNTVFTKVCLEKGLGEKQTIDGNWFKDVPNKFRIYFQEIKARGLIRQFSFQIISFSGYIAASLVIQAFQMPIILEGFPFYLLSLEVVIMGAMIEIINNTSKKQQILRKNIPIEIRI